MIAAMTRNFRPCNEIQLSFVRVRQAGKYTSVEANTAIMEMIVGEYVSGSVLSIANADGSNVDVGLESAIRFVIGGCGEAGVEVAIDVAIAVGVVFVVVVEVTEDVVNATFVVAVVLGAVVPVCQCNSGYGDNNRKRGGHLPIRVPEIERQSI